MRLSLLLEVAPLGLHRWAVLWTDREAIEYVMQDVEDGAMVFRHRTVDDWFPWCLRCRSKACEHAIAVLQYCREHDGVV